jgi:ankyrin repeat protein
MVQVSRPKGSHSGFNATLQFLLEFKAEETDIRKTQRGGALLIAAQQGDLWGIRLLLSAGVDVNTRGTEGLTPLMLATAGGYAEAVALLLQRGAEPNARDFFGETALTLALQHKHTTIAALLIKQGADVNVVVAHDDSTPLAIARRMKLTIIGFRLRRAGARR